MLTYSVFSRIKIVLGALGLVLGGALAAGVAHATVILSGSDTISYHAVTNEAKAAYKFLSNSGTGTVLLVNDFSAAPGYGGGGFGAFTSASSLPVSFSSFAGIMFASPGSCCSDPNAAVGTRAADLATFVAAGGNLYIEDYEGAAIWDAILGVPAGTGVAGLVSSSGCNGDPGVPTTQGLTFGYVGGSFGCYIHQIYNPTVWSPFGFVSLVDSGISGRPGAVILGSGAAAVVPEPASLALLGIGLAGLGAMRRRKTA